MRSRTSVGLLLLGQLLLWPADPYPAQVSARETECGQVPAAQEPTVGITVEGSSQGVPEISAPAAPLLPVFTGIKDIKSFLERCPDHDPAYSQIKSDFTVLIDGAAAPPFVCQEPISTMPIAQYSDTLIAYQTFRTTYYMAQGTAGQLPWTSLSLYAWMKSRIAGLNIKSAPGQLYCCDNIGGKLYFSSSKQDATQRDFKRYWPGIAITLDYFAHEIRHADPGAPSHVNCGPCPSGNPPCCDQTYNLANLGSYGVQYWLESKWATDNLSIGIGCSPQTVANDYFQWNANAANGFISRFVTNPPPSVTARPYSTASCLLSRIRLPLIRK